MKYVESPTESPEPKHGMRFTYHRGVEKIVKLASSFQVHLYTWRTTSFACAASPYKEQDLSHFR